jgi:hypothetical protein
MGWFDSPLKKKAQQLLDESCRLEPESLSEWAADYIRRIPSYAQTVKEERFLPMVREQESEVQDALAQLLLDRKTKNKEPWHFNCFPWGKAKLSPTTILQYLDLVLQGAEPGKEWISGGHPVDHYHVIQFQQILPRIPEETARSFVNQALAHYDKNGFRFSDEPEAYKLLKIISGFGEHVALQAWQENLFADKSIEEIVNHAVTCKGTTPSQKWQKKAAEIAKTVDIRHYREVLERSFEVMQKMPMAVDPMVSDQARGFVAFLKYFPDLETIWLLGKIMRATSDKIPGIGARCLKGFSGAVWTLEEMGTMEALAALSIAKTRVRNQTQFAQAEQALSRAAYKMEMTLEELEAKLVPDYDLDQNSSITFELGPDKAVLSLDRLCRANLEWWSGAKQVNSPTAAMKQNFGEEIDYIKRQKKELEILVSSQKKRLDRLFIAENSIKFSDWQGQYLNHPVLANLTNRLIWTFEREGSRISALPRNGSFTNSHNEEIEISADCTVRLWHPLTADDAEIVAWRDALISQEITQPLKQSFREIYVLTDAEIATRTYSNRFAAQILKQHQAVALMKERGWKASLQGNFDAPLNYPTRHLSAWDLTAEFFVAVVDGPVTDAGITELVSTDQVRFLRRRDPIPLVDVPPIVFSEIMRDVDLFVGVTSIGADPEWSDRGEQIVAQNWTWHEYSFGDLTPLAETRKAVLERLLPRMAIARQCELDDKFLKVHGKRHSYKIHLGSGNILIEPANRYLCIVPSGKKEDSIYLPFEGDRTLAVILSKAAMLVDDDKITDQTILSQL